jgi:hypothetical protein
MADLSVTPVAGQVKPPQVNSLADMLNIARGAQAYRQSEEINPLLVQERQQALNTQAEQYRQALQMNPLLVQQQQNVVQQGTQETERGGITLGQLRQADTERLAIQNLMATDPNSIMTNGMFDPAKLNAVIPKLAPYTGQEYISKFSTLGRAQNEFMDSSTKLSQGDKSVIAGPLGVLGRSGVTDPKVYLGELDFLAKQHEGNPNMLRLIKAQRDIISALPPGQHVAQGAIRASESLLAPVQQRETFAPQPGTVSTGSEILSTVTQPSVGGSTPTISTGPSLAQIQLPPGSRMSATGQMDMNNNPIYEVKDASGRVTGTVTVPAGVPEAWLPGAGGGGGGSQGAANPAPGQAAPRPAPGRATTVPVVPSPPSNAPVRMPAGENADTLKAAQQIRMTANNGAAEVPMQQFNSNQIIKLADDVTTGKGVNWLTSLSGGYAALPWTSDQATNLNQLGHYMALQTASLAKTAGLSGTDAANRLAGEMSGTTEWTAPAIKQTARVNRALSTATELFNMGVENAFKRSNSNPFSAREFQNKWSATTDINAVRLYDALKNNDKEAIAEVVRQAGGQNSAGYKSLVNKIGQMNALIKGQ